MSRLRLLCMMLTCASAALFAACSLLIETKGLADGDPDAAGAPRSDSASDSAIAPDAGGVSPLFAEDWEDGGDRWTGSPILEHEECSTTFQRETILAGGGRVKLVSLLPTSAGKRYCLVAWVRGSAGTQPFLGVDIDPQHHWLIGRAGYDNGYGGTAVPVQVDGAWHWYAAPFTVEDGGTTIDIIDELYKEGGPGTADFDDIRLYAEACPTAPTGAPHACP